MSKLLTQKIVKQFKKLSLNVTETDFEDFDKNKCLATGWGKESMYW